MRTTFLVVLRTSAVGVGSLTKRASEALESIFGDELKVHKLYSCKGEIEAINTECELTIEEVDDEFVAKCLIDVDATAKAQLSKVQIGDYLAEQGITTPAWKLEKRIVK